ncbi:uncharacterized protein LOC142796415 isoform X2 [Rhipicephalus microplus]|uniref:uncharacterized protein LOC142796415 isoform X2 n=1 Tax=Rhipicephalus microplus TaxID=6941 RepID=UPI003F6B9B01
MNSPMNMMVAILISIFGLVSASFDYDGRPTLEDVQKFYRSRENIYVLRRSFKLEDESGDSPKCIWNKRVDGDVFKLQEAYVVGLTVTYYTVTIDLKKEGGRDEAPTMTAAPSARWTARKIGNQQDGSMTTGRNGPRLYTFQYYDRLQQCAVVTFYDDALYAREDWLLRILECSRNLKGRWMFLLSTLCFFVFLLFPPKPPPRARSRRPCSRSRHRLLQRLTP